MHLMHDIFHLGTPWWALIARSAVIYLVMILGLRLFGKREVGQFTIFDLVLVLLIANAVQPAMTGPDSSLTGGLIIILTLLLFNLAVGQLRERSALFRRLVQPQPTVICQDGRWLTSALHHEGVDIEDVEAAVREHGIENVTDVKLAVLETDGSISIVPKDSAVHNNRRRLRYRRHNE
jgi:uncharacterized membrane protein YcaP (DUF421 family)